MKVILSHCACGALLFWTTHSEEIHTVIFDLRFCFAREMSSLVSKERPNS